MITRRQFLGSSAAAVMAAGTMARGTIFGANDRIRVCCIGVHGQGASHIKDLMERKDAEVVALCDVDSDVLAERAAAVEKATGKKPKTYKDARDVMANKDIDAITIATPNHWHTLLSIWGLQAGKDVYVEKPLAHSPWEAKQLLAAVQKSKQILMHGTQSRSNSMLMRDIQLMHEGFIGDIIHSRGYVYKNGNRGSISRKKPGKPPKNLDWTLWQGPSTDHEYFLREDGKNLGMYVHYNWHWFWEYGNGEIGNQGVHEMDLACWGHNRGLPVKVYSTGGRFGLDDDGETPNTQATSFTYADGSILTFEVRNLGSFNEGCDDDCSNSWFGTKGYYVRGKGFFDYKKQPIPVDKPMPESFGKWGYWLKAIQTRDPKVVTAPVEAGHIACVHIGIANAAYRLGRSLEFDPNSETFKDAEANKLLKREEYRKGFEVPQLA